MEYSVEDVAKLAKVSIRTLHYYDEVELLKPSLRVSNGKRLYDEEKILKLFDIILYKKMGFSLQKIKSLISLSNKDKKSLILLKKNLLQKEIERIKEMIESIDVTLDCFYRGKDLNYNEIIKKFESFQKNTKKEKEEFYKEFGKLKNKNDEKLQIKNLEDQTKEFQEKIRKVDMEKYNQKIFSSTQEIVKALENNLKVDSKEVQNLIKKYFEILSMIEPLSKEKISRFQISLSEDKNVYSQFAKIHTDLPEFLFKAIDVYLKDFK